MSQTETRRLNDLGYELLLSKQNHHNAARGRDAQIRKVDRLKSDVRDAEKILEAAERERDEADAIYANARVEVHRREDEIVAALYARNHAQCSLTSWEWHLIRIDIHGTPLREAAIAYTQAARRFAAAEAALGAAMATLEQAKAARGEAGEALEEAARFVGKAHAHLATLQEQLAAAEAPVSAYGEAAVANRALVLEAALKYGEAALSNEESLATSAPEDNPSE